MRTDHHLTEPAQPVKDERLAGFDCLFGASPHMAVLADAQGRILGLNRCATLQVMDARPGMQAALLYAPWAGSIVRSEGLPTARALGYWRGELDLAEKDGEAKPVSLLIEYQPAATEGEATYLLLNYELGEFDSYGSRLRFKRLFDAHPHPIWAYDLVTLRFLVVNAAAVDHYGYTESEFLDMTIKDIRPARSARATGCTAGRTARSSRWTFPPTRSRWRAAPRGWCSRTT
jgi:PAS domain-containing protein